LTVKKVAMLLLVLVVVVASATPALAAKKDKKKAPKKERTPLADENRIVGSNEDNDFVFQKAYNTGDVCNDADCVQQNFADFDTGPNLGRVQETGPGNLDGPITTVNDQTAQQGNQIGSGNQNQDFTDQNNVGVIEDNPPPAP
jgi:hypothetical protein